MSEEKPKNSRAGSPNQNNGTEGSKPIVKENNTSGPKGGKAESGEFGRGYTKPGGKPKK